MTVKGGINKIYKDWRRAALYFNLFNPGNTDVFANEKKLNDYTYTLYPELAGRTQYLKSTENTFDSQSLSNKEFEWIDNKNNLQCYFVWLHIRNIHFFNSESQMEYPYSKLNLNLQPSSHSERYRLIIHFFDLWAVQLTQKQQLNRHIISLWSNAYKEKSKLNWLNIKDKTQSEWAWKYLNNSKDAHAHLTPNSSLEEYFCVLTSILIWNKAPDSSELYLLKMKKAWAQVKHRSKSTNKKAYSMMMNKDIEDKLSYLTKRQNVKINALVERLINNAYEKEQEK